MNDSPLHYRMRTITGDRTFRAIAELCTQNPETVRRYMQGQSPSIEFVASLCGVFEVSADWLLTGRGPMRLADAKAQALQEANPADLLSAIASTLEGVCDRVDRIESYVHTIETRLRATRHAATAAEDVNDAAAQAQRQAAASAPDARSRRSRARIIADAVPERPRENTG